MSSETADGPAGVVKVLRDFLDDELRSEVIGGVSLAEVLDYVDLDVAYTPVVEHPVDDEFPRPEQLCVIALLKRDDGRYEARRQTDAGPTFDLFGPEQVRIMRARYLLCRDHFAPRPPGYEEVPAEYNMIHRVLAELYIGNGLFASVFSRIPSSADLFVSWIRRSEGHRRGDRATLGEHDNRTKWRDLRGPVTTERLSPMAGCSHVSHGEVTG